MSIPAIVQKQILEHLDSGMLIKAIIMLIGRRKLAVAKVIAEVTTNSIEAWQKYYHLQVV